MTISEFSNNFDVLVHSYTRLRDFDNKEPYDTIEFNEYEKSLYLTKAQEEVVLELYNGKNAYRESFEQTEELRRYLADLIEEKRLDPITNSSNNPIGGEGSAFFSLPETPPVWFITYESVAVSNADCSKKTMMDVYPVRQDEYSKIRTNPFRGANNRRVLRLDLSDGVIEIVSKPSITVQSYYIRYLRKPKPIILVDLPNNLSFNGISLASTKCEVHEGLHQRILERAVSMALASKGILAGKDNKDNKQSK